MKRLPFFLLLLCFYPAMSQHLTLQISGERDTDARIIDSLGYNASHENLKSLYTELNSFSQKAMQMGYIGNEIKENQKVNDTLYRALFSAGNQTKDLLIYIGAEIKKKTKDITAFETDTIRIAFTDSEVYLNNLLGIFETKGYAFAKVRLVHFRSEKDNLLADLQLETGLQRQVNDIVINGYDKFPEGHRSAVKRNYRNKTFNKDNLDKIRNDFNKFRFVTQIRNPEILFTQDTTKVYVYLEKAKPNKFEGFLGFTNDEQQQVVLSGYLDLLMVNLLNSGEELSLYWKSDGMDQKTFNAALDLPYVFKSRIGLKLALNIFKQDSTFQNTKTSLEAGYFFRYNLRAYAGYQSSESSDIQNANTSTLTDFQNAFYTLSLDYFDYKTDDFLFPEKTRIYFKFGTGNRDIQTGTNSQYFAQLDAKHSFYLNENNIINIRSQNYYLKSGHYITNELFRFGGINSIRGFNENSLQGNVFTSLLSEYRYRVTSALYVKTLFDYGYYRDETTHFDNKMMAFGLGFGILTRNGLLNLIYAAGSANDQQIKLSNAIVHLSFTTNF